MATKSSELTVGRLYAVQNSELGWEMGYERGERLLFVKRVFADGSVLFRDPDDGAEFGMVDDTFSARLVHP